MKRASKFVFSSNWKLLLHDMNIDVNDVLVRAGLPADLFIRENPQLTPAEYYRFWQAVELSAGNVDVPLLLAKHLSVEAFDAPIFASLCSRNLNQALERIREYKPLIGPLILTVDVDPQVTRLEIECYGYETMMPSALGLGELIFFTQLARLATRSRVEPVAVQLPELPENLASYREYFGCDLQQGEVLSVTFTAEDAARPFLTANAKMWEFFEGDLKRRLKDLHVGASIYDRVKAVLLEALPGGNSTIEHVASELSISKRTLQRKLSDESKSFQQILVEVRAQLADHYLEGSNLSLGEISFMLGFRETNSFIRAYHGWKGMPPGQYRELALN